MNPSLEESKGPPTCKKNSGLSDRISYIEGASAGSGESGDPQKSAMGRRRASLESLEINDHINVNDVAEERKIAMVHLPTIQEGSNPGANENENGNLAAAAAGEDLNGSFGQQ